MHSDSIKNEAKSGGGTYGVPYRALLASGRANLLCAGMLITAGWEAYMSTRNIVCSRG